MPTAGALRRPTWIVSGSCRISPASFAITGTSAYTLSASNSIAAGLQPSSLAEDSTGTFLLGVNNLGGPYFSSYTFNSTTAGKLDIQIVANTGASPQVIVAAPQ